MLIFNCNKIVAVCCAMIVAACPLLLDIAHAESRETPSSDCREANSSPEIASLIAALGRAPVPHMASDENVGDVYSLLLKAQNIVDSREAIKHFRCLDNVEVIVNLVDLASSDQRAIRISAGLLLANVVDNSTICAVINKLLSGDMNLNSRYNLWQVVKIVASYARVENREWIVAAIRAEKARLENTRDAVRTLNLLEQIQRSVDSNIRSDSLQTAQYQDAYNACVKLPEISKVAKNN